MGNRHPEPRLTEGSTSPQPGVPPDTEKIRRLKAKASHGLFAMAIFIAMSIGAVRDFDFLPSFPPRVHALLGHPPSANMISTALLLYSFAAIVLILSRMMGGSGSFSGFAHVAYLAGFYFFYHFSGAMEENFWAVFAAGVTILGLESYHIWNFCTEEVRKEQEILLELGRNDHKQEKPED
jgi:hypothetical protein